MNLVKYEAARAALAAAHRVDEVKEIRDKAQAMSAYARQAKDTELVEWATEIKVRAERRAGAMLADIQRISNRKAGDKDGSGILSTLERIDVPIATAHRWQKLAAIPERKFEQAIAESKDLAGEVTTAALLRLTRPKKRKPAALPGPKDEPEDEDDPEPTPEQYRLAFWSRISTAQDCAKFPYPPGAPLDRDMVEAARACGLLWSDLARTLGDRLR